MDPVVVPDPNALEKLMSTLAAIISIVSIWKRNKKA